MTFVCRLIIVAILLQFALHILPHFPVAYSRYPSLNKKCNVFFNYTHQYMETSNRDVYTIYMSCWNNTLKQTMGLNLTRNEEWNCRWKCFQIADEIALDDGTLNPNFVDKVTKEYTKYSNATTFFIKKVASMLSQCEKQTVEIYKSLEVNNNGSNSIKCQLNGIYEDCWGKVYWTPTTNAINEQLCGDHPLE